MGSKKVSIVSSPSKKKAGNMIELKKEITEKRQSGIKIAEMYGKSPSIISSILAKKRGATRPVLELLGLCKIQPLALHVKKSIIIEAAKGLSTFAKHEKHIKKLVELGGTQTLVVLASVDNMYVLGHVTSGLHALVTHPPLHKHLAESGVIKAICKILSHVGDTQEQIAIDGISALMIFCKYQSLKTKVLIDGGLQPVLNLCWSNKHAISLLSITTLGLIAEHPATHTTIFDNRQNAVSRLLQLANAPDEQLQEVALKTLAYLSTGIGEYRHRLIQEDASTGHCLQVALTSKPTNPQILCNAACLTANLATSAQDQNELQGLLWTACQKLAQAEANTELLSHLTRALANFSQHKQHENLLINAIPDVVKYCLKSSNSTVQLHGMRLLVNLLAQAPGRVSSVLASVETQAFLACLGGIPSVIDALQSSLNEVPAIVKPL